MKPRGVIVGKFYPPHKGHEYLIRQALTHVEDLAVMVCDKESQSIPGALRAEWLQELFPQVKVLVVADTLADDDSNGWAEYTIKLLGYKPDMAFTSESYGDAFAHFLGAKHILIDMDRRHVPISATAIRNDPMAHWEYLIPGGRAYYAKRVCVLGAESTGKTTLAQTLADHFKTVWVPEYGRLYSEGRWKSLEMDPWRTDEFVHIARQQNMAEDAFARSCLKILFCDTDSFATTLWHERYMGFVSKEVDAVSEGRSHDLYLLADTDVPFVQDGLRDGEHLRQSMHERFVVELERRKKSYLLLSGTYAERFQQALTACERLLSPK